MIGAALKVLQNPKKAAAALVRDPIEAWFKLGDYLDSPARAAKARVQIRGRQGLGSRPA